MCVPSLLHRESTFLRLSFRSWNKLIFPPESLESTTVTVIMSAPVWMMMINVQSVMDSRIITDDDDDMEKQIGRSRKNFGQIKRRSCKSNSFACRHTQRVPALVGGWAVKSGVGFDTLNGHCIISTILFVLSLYPISLLLSLYSP